MNFMAKLNRAMNIKLIEIKTFNGGDIIEAYQDINITHEGISYPLRMIATSSLSYPKSEYVGYTQEDVESKFEIIFYTTNSRTSGTIYKKLKDIFQDSDPEDKQFISNKNKIINMIKMSDEDLNKATDRRRAAFQHYNEMMR